MSAITLLGEKEMLDKLGKYLTSFFVILLIAWNLLLVGGIKGDAQRMAILHADIRKIAEFNYSFLSREEPDLREKYIQELQKISLHKTINNIGERIYYEESIKLHNRQ